MTVERVLQPPWVKVLGLTLLATGMTLYTYWPAIALYPATPWGDGQYTHHLVEAAKVSVSRYHELPLWDPFECAGRPLWDEPESVAAAPLLFLLQPFSTTTTMRLWNIIHHIVGFICMWLFSRHELRLSRGAALVASTVFSLTLANVSQYVGGHAALVGFLYAPLALLLWRNADQDLRHAVGLGLLFAWMFFEGGGYPTAHIGLVLLIESLTRVSPRVLLRFLRAGVVTTLTFVTVGAARLLPVVDQLLHHSRDLPKEVDRIEPKLLYEMYFARTHDWKIPNHYVWAEYNAYLGMIIVFLALAGLVFSMRDHPWFFAVGTLVLAIMLGHFASWAPWHLLKGYVFPWRSMRVPSRFRLLFVLFLGGWAGLAVDRIPQLASRWLGTRIGLAVRTATLGVALLGAGDALAIAAAKVAASYTSTPQRKDIHPSEHLFIGDKLPPLIDQPRQNQGRPQCWEEWNFTQGAPIWTGDVPQAKADGQKIVIGNVSRTQNTFTIEVDAKEPGPVRVNSPYERGWRTDKGSIRSEKKLLIVDVPAGQFVVHLRYWPRGLTAGFSLTALGLLSVTAFFLWDARRRKAGGTARLDPRSVARLR
jgi:hypothetical protein